MPYTGVVKLAAAGTTHTATTLPASTLAAATLPTRRTVRLFNISAFLHFCAEAEPR
jgi:hypothetical protein